MAVTTRILGQSAPSATTLTDVYTVASGKQATVSSVTVANRAATATTFRLSVASAGEADALKHYLYYDVPLPANDSFTATIGITLAATDKLRIYVGAANVSVNCFGAEEDV
jgi:hypothetical protein